MRLPLSFLRLRSEDKQQLNRIEAMLVRLTTTGATIIMTIQDLKTQVEKNTAIEESAVTLIQGLAAQIKAAQNDPAAIQALADELTKSAADLAGAITANTPAAPAGA